MDFGRLRHPTGEGAARRIIAGQASVPLVYVPTESFQSKVGLLLSRAHEFLVSHQVAGLPCLMSRQPRMLSSKFSRSKVSYVNDL